MALCYDISALQEEMVSPEGKELPCALGTFRIPVSSAPTGGKGKAAKDCFPMPKNQ